MLKRLAAAAVLLALTSIPMPAAPLVPLPPVLLYRLDCGDFLIRDYNAFFSDTSAYPSGPKPIVGSCYLIRDRNRNLLWDTGVEAKLVGAPSDNPVMRMSLRRTIVDQLAMIGIRPAQIEMVGISHYHGDHTGQAASFPNATLLIGQGDLDALKADPGLGAEMLAPWLKAGGKVKPARGDLDVFGDGMVVMLDTPGHTPGHHSLLVRLGSGPVILSGDLWHFREQVGNDGVPPFNTNRADTLASMDRIKRLMANIHARLIIQHEPADVALLPAFPKAAQ
jgi:N-acyl homoserine lactone hydrolase